MHLRPTTYQAHSPVLPSFRTQSSGEAQFQTVTMNKKQRNKLQLNQPTENVETEIHAADILKGNRLDDLRLGICRAKPGGRCRKKSLEGQLIDHQENLLEKQANVIDRKQDMIDSQEERIASLEQQNAALHEEKEEFKKDIKNKLNETMDEYEQSLKAALNNVQEDFLKLSNATIDKMMGEYDRLIEDIKRSNIEEVSLRDKRIGALEKLSRDLLAWRKKNLTDIESLEELNKQQSAQIIALKELEKEEKSIIEDLTKQIVGYELTISQKKEIADLKEEMEKNRVKIGIGEDLERQMKEFSGSPEELKKLLEEGIKKLPDIEAEYRAMEKRKSRNGGFFKRLMRW